MLNVRRWLAELGLNQYAEVFDQNGIRSDVLLDLTDGDLKELGVSLGDRKRLLKAVAALRQTQTEPTAVSAASASHNSSDVLPQHGAERRQLTILFCDLVGSTALAARLDPEEMSEIIREYQTCCADVIEQFGGHVAKYMGDGLLAYFGYPQAHENEAERAVYVGLGVAEAVPKLSFRQGIQLQVRIGIATGLVVVGELIGTGTAQERTVVGDTPVLAQRLQAVAGPNSVVVAESTRHLLRDLFNVEELGAQTLKGFDATVRAFRVNGEGRAESRFEAMHAGGMTPLVGREQEIGLLLARWERVVEGDGLFAVRDRETEGAS